ncbi:ankyrin repeat and LEM domain-containing protein 1 [Oncorhynchus keta]|uniref:ankyrin repeat and LEM domain-containing protein 1 n=1 Tax=Oncorhynchus keta TaxID=8018 RepID=UPI00227C24EF|nr:ankyrin repeat and LEM domain-containing protein 1 [Oncorhynchus keta]XP_052331395.1 ankyrin repeat and LEM domain-containing protein 1 [Oncorhynchus keta]XP_052331396.1 ankyrin repeat and LEM domain-containing protein 1 [Oncorhynchus keta]XP_052331397.1 ankyrin repeat and LEM domain-containing protein 1 [Oncorhynchus keta]XP_052331398.1 ankyrin repeat and LEM domain-containing protein 1 [Oncorhynchus keta]XP_052331399.1 ankyrin repeat and LEM domain-containing protein 1 [Oncorhynchus keta]
MQHRSKTSLATQLCKAVNDGEPRTVQILLAQGANPNLVGSKGVAAVHLAVGKETEKSIRCLKLILQHGADPNIRSSDGLTPLHVAALWGCYQNLKLLLKNGGNANLKDQEGNKPGDLAQQQDNRRCAHLLQEYQSQSLDTEEEDLPQFQYSVYNSQGDASSYTDSEDCSVFSHSMSLLSDFGEGPLSSTRQTSFFELSAISNRHSWRRGSHSGASNCKSNPEVRHTNEWDTDSDWEPPSMLSSTRMSVAGPRAALPVLREDVPLADCSALHPSVNGNRLSPPPVDLLPPCFARRTSRKSVSFREEADEYFPVFSSESPRREPGSQGTAYSKDYTLDFSEYSEFLDPERMATVLHHQGIDVTSPEHVFVFSKDNNECTEIDMEKTFVGHFPFEEEDGEVVENQVEEVKVPERALCGPAGSSSSSGASRYSSCDSDHYITTLEASPRRVSPSEEERKVKSRGVEDDKHTQNPMTTNNVDTDETPNSSERSKPAMVELPAMVDNLTLTDKISPSKGPGCEKIFPDAVLAGNVEELSTRPTECTPRPGPGSTPALEEDLPLTPSPFVTGRTHSRLSRCSVISGKTPESLLSTSSLFEQTLPTPTRTRRQNIKSRGSDNVFYDTPCGRSRTPVFSGNGTGSTSGDSFVIYESQEPQSSTLRADRGQGSYVSASQADTLIIAKDDRGQGSCVSSSQADTLIIAEDDRGQGSCVSSSQADTLIIAEDDRGQGSCVSASQADTLISKTMADTVIVTPSLADKLSLLDNYFTLKNPHKETLPTYLRKDVLESCEFLTDDLSSSSDAVTKEGTVGSFGPRVEESWTTEEADSSSSLSSSQTPSSSSSSYFSPKRDQPPSTPGTTPRYSMSRLSHFHKPQRLANLSYTPGGRPQIPDLEEPVEYLYTDTEQGHELIETHVPPAANTSLSSSMSTSSGEDTVLYDWRSLQGGGGTVAKGKENQEPVVAQEWSETKCLTDKELRRRLVEMGESPGPISHRTRPVYMKRLRRLLLEPDTQQQLPDQPQGPAQGHSPELCVALRTLVLPDCQEDELALCQQFDQPDQNRKWREGVIKSSFNYLLLDPRVTKNLPYRSHSMSPVDCFQTFISAIFYVGKGKRSRPYSHLYEALDYHRGDKTSKKLCSKVQHILQVWKAEQGVISLHCFQNVIPVEAYTREAVMVDAIGLKMLTNQKRGDYYGVVSTWQLKRKRELGVHLLYRAMQIFLAEGERQLRPPDIRVGQ